MALDTHTKRLLWSGLRAGLSAGAAGAAGLWGIFGLVELSIPTGRTWGGAIAAITLLALMAAGPVAAAWAVIGAQRRTLPFTVRHPENAVAGAVWGGWGGLLLFGFQDGGPASAAALAAAIGVLAALVPYRIVWPALVVSPLPPILLHLLLGP